MQTVDTVETADNAAIDFDDDLDDDDHDARGNVGSVEIWIWGRGDILTHFDWFSFLFSTIFEVFRTFSKGFNHFSLVFLLRGAALRNTPFQERFSDNFWRRTSTVLIGVDEDRGRTHFKELNSINTGFFPLLKFNFRFFHRELVSCIRLRWLLELNSFLACYLSLSFLVYLFIVIA